MLTRREMRLLLAAQLLGNKGWDGASEEQVTSALLVAEGVINVDRVVFSRDGNYLRPDRRSKKGPVAMMAGYELAKLELKQKAAING